MRPEHEAIERRIPDEFGYACAEALGVDAYCPLPPGCDGKVFLVEDGDDCIAMKVTTSAVEAVLCKALADAGSVPGFFSVRDVRSTVLDDGGTAYVILRDEVSEVFQDPGPDEAYAVMRWSEAAHSFDGGWYLQDEAILDRALRKAPPEASLDRALSGLRWLRSELGVVGRDLHLDNFGRAPDGHVCVRDLSRFSMSALALESGLARIEPMPTMFQKPDM